MRDDKGWRIFVSVEARPVKQVSRQELGAIGVDVNADHLAVSEMDRFGNLIGARRIDLVTYGKTQDQAKALIGDAAVALAAQAQAAGKPIVLETLNFQKKKAELETTNPKQARMISSFACNKIASSIKAAAFRAGIEVIEVNPAYTSVIGAVNFAQAKAFQYSRARLTPSPVADWDCPNVRPCLRPSCQHATAAMSPSPYLQGIGPSCGSFWSKVRTSLKAAHVAHFRCGAHKTARHLSARKSGSVSYLEFHGAIPWRESFPKLFGERLAGCPILAMEHLSMVLGTV
ncbi:MAG: IS200/IS605 family accessory protein TnpB-related protein [Rhodoferax sp.]|nr:IS200/IS605 family accessory protein TnpB-related protein [Rhodoferax sp.]